MKLLICTERDKDFQTYIHHAQASGHTVYVDDQKGEYFIKIGHERIWRADDAEFQPVQSGTYVYDKDGKPHFVG